ncbi:hypothetical protein [Clostridium tyrobutyricum]|uniref:hypothetical protein n=1 Tax=Clostridium tyrobutyricum TaxID=1519 RepID=UPI00031A3F82|nr:hypothetical protein [Clostridium tyrobutyricum]
MDEYRPEWPRNVMFWGAGATAALGFKTTVYLGKFFMNLCKEYDKGSIYKNFHDVTHDKNIDRSLENLFKFLDSSKDLEDISKEIDEEFEDNGTKRVKELREYYDWNSLMKIMKVCPNYKTDKMELQDLFNMIDMHIIQKEGFYVNDGKEQEFLPLQNIIKSRNTLVMMTTLVHSLNYNFNVLKHKDMLDSYYGFALCLGKLMQEEGFESYNNGNELNIREFYMYSYSVISLNWDPILLWMIFNANKELNSPSKVPYIGSPLSPMKLFNDMGNFMAVRKIESEKQEIWYPLNETIVQRLNDPEYQTGRRVRIGKFYFPHGSSNWRECPNCGKLFMYLGHEWSIYSKSLFPPQLIPKLSFNFKVKSSEEEKASKNNQTDFIQCPFCGTMVSSINTPIVMQSNFKGNYPPSIENIQRDMRISVENAKHIILMGYTLPKDDVIYRTMFAAKINRGNHYCSVVVGKDDKFPDRWLNGDELEKYINGNNIDEGFVNAVKSAIDIFGSKNVRGYGRGIPDVFLEGGKVDMKRVKNLMEYS